MKNLKTTGRTPEAQRASTKNKSPTDWENLGFKLEIERWVLHIITPIVEKLVCTRRNFIWPLGCGGIGRWSYGCNLFYFFGPFFLQILSLSGSILVERMCDIFCLSCALPDKSMKLCLQGFLSMLISKSAGTTMLFQWFSLKNAKFKWPLLACR